MSLSIIRFFSTTIGAIIGYYIGRWYCLKLQIVPEEIRYTNLWGIISAGGMLGYLLGPFLKERIRILEESILKLKPSTVLAGITGLLAGLLISTLLSFPLIFSFNPSDVLPLVFIIYIVISYIIGAIFLKLNLFSKYFPSKDGASPKILDTSVIIDGRIADISQTGFIEGELLIPHFVFEELRHIADSSDVLRRNRGRRGLDVLKKMQAEIGERMKFIEDDFEEISEVDDKLLKLAEIKKATIITNDYNLNKAANLKGIKVLNINELANALKPVVLPGEEMKVQVIKEGKEPDQGVGYLDDGTMIVIEDGINYLGETIEVSITNMLQTPAGRVIFARPKETRERIRW
jgi:uncharacterized protein YacL